MMTITIIKRVLTIINNDNNKNNHNHTNTDSNDSSNNNNNNSGDDDDDDNQFVKNMGYLRSHPLFSGHVRLAHGDLADGNSGVQTSHGQDPTQCFSDRRFFLGKITSNFP